MTPAVTSVPKYPRSSLELADWLKSGKKVVYPDSASLAERTIDTQWFVKTLFAGHERKTSAPIYIEGAFFSGDLWLAYAECEFELPLVNCGFGGKVDFASARFKRFTNISKCRFFGEATFRSCVFHGQFRAQGARFLAPVFFSGAKWEAAARFDPHFDGTVSEPTRFFAEAEFEDTNFGSLAQFEGAKFLDRVTFRRSQMLSDARFRIKRFDQGRDPASIAPERTTFLGETVFSDVHIQGAALFEGALFAGTVWAQRIAIDGSAFLSAIYASNSVWKTTFLKAADFRAATFGGEARFNGVDFNCSASFRRVRFGATAAFDPVTLEVDPVAGRKIAIPTHIGGEADFRDVTIQGSFYLDGVTFDSTASFEHLEVRGNALFRSYRNAAMCQPIVFGGNVSLLRASIGGTSDFTGALFKADLELNWARLGSSCGFSSALASGRLFITTIRGKANFYRMSVGSIFFQGCRFGGPANFDRVQVTGDAFFNSLRLQSSEPGSIYEGAIVPTTFIRDATFRDANISGKADFSGIQFEAVADFSRATIADDVHFGPVTTETFLLPSTFLGDALFSMTDVGGDGNFQSTQFYGRVSFVKAKFADSLNLNCSLANQTIIPTLFWREADFARVRVNGRLDLRGTRFQGQSWFGAMQVDGDAAFNTFRLTNLPTSNPLRGVEVNTAFSTTMFNDAKFGGFTDFSGARFYSPANLWRVRFGTESRLDGTVFAAAVWFNTSRFGRLHCLKAIFKQTAGFDLSVAESNADFWGSEFYGDAGFSEARFETLRFSGPCNIRLEDQHKRAEDLWRLHRARNPEVINRVAAFLPHLKPVSRDDAHHVIAREAGFLSWQDLERYVEGPDHALFFKSINLQGLTYARFYGAWRYALTRMDPYDRQPFVHMEKLLRASGNDRSANEIYYAGRIEERDKLKKRFRGEDGNRDWPSLPDLAFDWLQKCLFHYGVPAYRFAYFTIAFLMLGIGLLFLPHAIESKSTATFEFKSDSSGLSLKWPSVAEKRTWWEPVKVATAIVSPTEKLTLETNWKPASNPQGIAGAWLLRLMLFVFLPLSVANLSGLFKRRESA